MPHTPETTKTARRRLGAVETPPALARRLVARVAEAAGGRLPAGPVYDPAAGEGALLLAWLDREAAQKDAAGVARQIHERVLACDINPVAVARTRAELARRFGGSPGALDMAHLHVGDAFAWDPRDAGVGAPTLILANPPWISLSGRQRGHSTGSDQADASAGSGRRGPATWATRSRSRCVRCWARRPYNRTSPSAF